MFQTISAWNCVVDRLDFIGRGMTLAGTVIYFSISWWKIIPVMVTSTEKLYWFKCRRNGFNVFSGVIKVTDKEQFIACGESA